jgi:hypothetical protein
MAPRKRSLAFGLLFATSAFLGGFFLAHPASERIPQQRTGSAEDERLRAKVAQLELELAKAKNEELRSAAPAIPNPIHSVAQQRSDDLEALARLTRDKIVKFQMPVVAANGAITKQLIELFNLTQPEIEALQDIVTKAKTHLAQHALETATLKQADASSVVIVVPPFGQGLELMDGVLTGVEKILGKDRYAVFHTLELDELNKSFGSFGATQRTVTVRLNTRDDGSSSWLLTEQHVGPTGSIAGSGVNVATDRAFPPDFAWLTNFRSNFAVLEPAFKTGVAVSTAVRTKKIQE